MIARRTSELNYFRCAQAQRKKSQIRTPTVSVRATSPEEKFTHTDLAYLRHVYKQYILIDTESTVAMLTPTDVEGYVRAARERRPFSYDLIETCHAIPDRSSNKV